jgi:N-acetyl-gamma-glutamyl-phosphate reductase
MGLPTAVFGASGYGGGELIRLLDGHDGFDIVYLGAHRHAGGVLGDVHPQLPLPERPLGAIDAKAAGEVAVAFLALPHGESAGIGHQLASQDIAVIDLGSDWRLDTAARYEEAYGAPHPYPNDLAGWRYGLPELFDLAGAKRVASPGCYPTATLLAIAPLVRAGMVASQGIVANCLSGVSGAGRALTEEMLFGEVAEGVRAYGVTTHRHRPEIEMGLDLLHAGRHTVTFVPHLVPIQRGLLATVTAPLLGDHRRPEVLETLAKAYAGAGFVEVIDRAPQTRWTLGSNRALVTAWVDSRQGLVISQCAIDNLLKGAAGQALQAANIVAGYPEDQGLPRAGWMP